MSYRCAVTGQIIPPGVAAVKVVLAIRPVIHPPRQGATRRRILRKWRRIDDAGGEGHEIAREALVHPDVARELAGKPPVVEAARPRRVKTRTQEVEEALWGAEGSPSFDSKGRRR